MLVLAVKEFVGVMVCRHKVRVGVVFSVGRVGFVAAAKYVTNSLC